MEDSSDQAPEAGGVEADAQKKYEETRKLYAKAKHDDAVTKRCSELIAADNELPKPADLDELITHLADRKFDEAKKQHLENVATQRALKRFDEWKRTAPVFDCPNPWHINRPKDRTTTRCQSCGGVDERRLKAQ